MPRRSGRRPRAQPRRPARRWRRVRALSPHIGAWAELHGRRVTIWRARLEDGALRARARAAGGARQDGLRRVPARRPVIAPARKAAYEVVRRVFEEEAYADRALASAVADLDARDRALAQRLAYGTVQMARTLDFGIEQLGKRPVRKLDAPVLAALRLGAYQLAFTDQADARGRRRRRRARACGAPRARGAVHERRHAPARAGLPGARRLAAGGPAEVLVSRLDRRDLGRAISGARSRSIDARPERAARARGARRRAGRRAD